MTRFILPLALLAAAAPAHAASGPFFSLRNTDFVVLLGFLLFIAILIYFKVPGMLGGLLDKRAEGIQGELDEARAMREEAQALLASYERKARDVQDQADRIVAHAKQEAETAAEAAKVEMKEAIARRLAAAESQIESAQAKAVKDVRDKAAEVAISAARTVAVQQIDAAKAGQLVDAAIGEVGAKLH